MDKQIATQVIMRMVERFLYVWITLIVIILILIGLYMAYTCPMGIVRIFEKGCFGY